MNVLLFDKRNAHLVASNRALVQTAKIIAFMQDDGQFNVLKDCTGTLKVGEIASYSKVSMAMSNAMFNYLYHRS